MNTITAVLDDQDNIIENNDEFSLHVKKKNRKNNSQCKYTEQNDDYTYLELLNKIYTIMNERNSKTFSSKKVIPVPKLVRVGTKRISWLNFMDTSQVIGRTVEHMMSFFLAELGTEGNLDGNKYFIMKGRYTVSQIEYLLKKYIMEYVRCSICNTMETSIIRNQTIRLYFIKCERCMSSRSISVIKSVLKK